MKVVYIGAVDFSYHCLERLIQLDVNVVGIATMKNNSYNSDYKDLTPIGQRENIPIHYFNNINDNETITWIKEMNPDIIFCWGISQLIKNEVLSIPPMGVVGVHPALLPANRGRHPIIWALVLGLNKTGLTFFLMDEGADSGPILSQREIAIEGYDDSSSLYEKIKQSASEQIDSFIPKIIEGTFNAIKQEDNNANYWRKRTKKDGIIDWRMSSSAILNLIKALNRPYPGAETSINGRTFKIWKASLYPKIAEQNFEHGRILFTHNGMPVIKTYDGAIMLESYDEDVEFNEGGYLD